MLTVICEQKFRFQYFIFFTEIWLNPNIIGQNFCPLWYNIIRNDRLSGGGVAVIFNDSIKLIEVKTNIISSDGFEFICFGLIS